MTFPHQIDFDGINAALLRNGRAFVENLIPGGKFRSLEYVVKNPRRDDKEAGSFTINYRTGVWKDFATGDCGGDLVSLWAFVRNIDQGEAARQIAEKYSVPLYKMNGVSGHRDNTSTFTSDRPLKTKENFEDSKPVVASLEAADDQLMNGGLNGRANGAASDTAPRVYPWGEEGPSVRQDEIRRHFYPNGGAPRAKVKIKSKGAPRDNWVIWYRIFRNGVPMGWQAKKPWDYQAIPYRSTAIDPFDTELIADEILWPEGEKDVDTLNKLNLPSFTFGGVGDGLPDGIAPYLKDRRLVILADNDEPGRAHAEKKAAIAYAAGAALIKIVHFPDLPPKGDVSDFITSGGTADQLTEHVDRSPLWSPASKAAAGTSEPAAGKTSELVSLATIKPEATDWLWHHRIPRGAQTISTGWPGVGKSQQQCDIVAHASTGTPWPDGSPCPRGDTVMLTCEDSYAKTVVPRLLGAGADLERVYVLPIIRVDAQTKRAFLLTEDLDELERHLNALPNRILVTIDPITGFLGSGKINSNSVTDIRGALAPLSDLAERYNIAIHTVTHPPKTTSSAMNAFIGSQAFVAASRMAYLTTEEMDEEGRPTGRFLMAMVRSSLGPKLPTLAYRLEQREVDKDHRDGRMTIGSYLVWEDGVVDISASAALAAASGGSKGSSQDHTAKADCTEFLKTVLADGWIEVANITAEAISAGLLGEGKQIKDSKPMRDAKTALNVDTHREGFGKGAHYFWALPGTPWESHRRPHSPIGALPNEWAPMDEGGRL